MVVVGGGLLGVSAAYHLAVAGRRPLLLEAGALGDGASGRSAGMVVPGLAVPYPYAVAVLGHEPARDLYGRTVENVALVRDLVAREEIDCALAADGLLTLGLGDAQSAAGRRLAATLTADGFAARIVERDELAGWIGTPVAARVGGGLYQADGVTVDPARLVTGLADAACRHGAEVRRAVTVHSLTSTAGHVRLQTSAGPVSADAAVVALNAWTPTVVPALGPLLRPTRAQMLAYEPSAAVFGVPLTASLSEHGEYWRQTTTGEILVGGRRDRDRTAAGTAGAASAPTDEVQQAIEEVLPALFPQLRLPRVRGRWAGAMAMTPDGLPIAGPVPGTAHAWFAAGCNGHGLAFAVLLGRALAAAVQDGRAPASLAPFALSRPTLR